MSNYKQPFGAGTFVLVILFLGSYLFFSSVIKHHTAQLVEYASDELFEAQLLPMLSIEELESEQQGNPHCLLVNSQHGYIAKWNYCNSEAYSTLTCTNSFNYLTCKEKEVKSSNEKTNSNK